MDKHIKSLTVNWHILSACNFSCDYCFADWSGPTPKHRKQPEICCNDEQTIKLLLEIKKLKSIYSVDVVKLNLAGGEPMLLYKTGKLDFIISQAKKCDLNVTMITNGFFLDDDSISTLIPNLSTLGISYDTLNPKTAISIGRVPKNDQINFLTLDKLKHIVEKCRQVNTEIKIKINTVVNKYNYKESFADVLEKIQPDRWKILQMLPIKNTNLSITDEQFRTFVKRHKLWNKIAVIENNDEMKSSYLMINPYGDFFDNTGLEFDDYNYSKNIINVGIQKALSQINFDLTKFSQRY